MKFPGYFLIVADFIKWSKANGVPVGPGRGSGAGSLVAYSLTITDLDPLRFGLLFERFLNPERISMPDFDIDFCQEKRDRVIDYVQKKYGADRVAQIITHGKLQARAVLRSPVQARAEQPRQSRDAKRGDRGRTEAAGRARSRTDRRAPSRDRAKARGTESPRFDARRRHGDRR
jgi:DNA polymerase III alpha subunit